MKSTTPLRSVAVLALALTGAALGHAQLTNPGFEMGNLSGWQISTGGHASVVGSVTDYPIDPSTLTEDLTKPYWASPYAGNYQARLVAGGTALASTESFLGLGAGSLSNRTNNPFGLADASAIAQNVWLNAGDSLQVHWNFLAVDTSVANDFAFLTWSGATSSSVTMLSSVAWAGSGQATGWQTATVTANASGQYRLGLGVANFEDNTVGSILYADAISAVPEPSTYGIAAAFICLGAALWRKRQTRRP